MSVEYSLTEMTNQLRVDAKDWWRKLIQVSVDGYRANVIRYAEGKRASCPPAEWMDVHVAQCLADYAEIIAMVCGADPDAELRLAIATRYTARFAPLPHKEVS